MIAIIKTGGKQYSVKAGQVLKVEKLDGKKGDSISFKNVLALSDASENTFGNPLIEGAYVEAKILDQIRDKKIIVFKKRRRQNYRLTQGHRQYLTVLKIESINHKGKKIALKKEAKVIAPKSKDLKVENDKDSKKKVVKKATSTKKTAKQSVKKKVVAKKVTKSKK